MLSSHVMPDSDTSLTSRGQKTAFIWYHADAQLIDVLQTWVGQMGQTLNIPSRLMVRSQPERTTFMEIYEASGSIGLEDILESIERNAAKQPWFAQLQSSRKAEIFVEVQAQATPSAS